MEKIVQDKYFKEFYEVWYETVKIMNDQNKNNKLINEGIVFVED